MKNFGVDVTIVEFLDRMVPTEDADVSKELLKHYKKLGVKVLLGTKVECVEDTGSGVQGHGQPGRRRRPAGARGRQAALGHRLRAAHRGLRPRGGRRRSSPSAAPIAIDELRPHQRAERLRDRRLTAKLMLAHVAEAMGIVAAETIAGAETMPSRLRLHPARDLLPAADRLVRLLRGAGQGEGLRRQDRDVPVLRQRQGAWASARPSASSRSSPTPTHNEILGAHMIGPDVTELLPVLTLAQKWDLTADEVARNVFAHPTLVRGHQGGRRGHRRPHDQPLSTGSRNPDTRQDAPAESAGASCS